MYRMFGGTEPQSSNGYLQEPLSLREEFRSRRFGLGHSNPSDFLRSQVGFLHFPIELLY